MQQQQHATRSSSRQSQWRGQRQGCTASGGSRTLLRRAPSFQVGKGAVEVEECASSTPSVTPTNSSCATQYEWLKQRETEATKSVGQVTFAASYANPVARMEQRMRV